MASIRLRRRPISSPMLERAVRIDTTTPGRRGDAATGAFLRRFHDCKTNELAEPACIAVLRVSSFDHRRQVLEKRIEWPRVAGEIASNELGRGWPAAAVVDKERQSVGGGNVEYVRCERISAHAGATRHDMLIAIGENHDFAGFDRDRLPAGDSGEAPARCNHMIGDASAAMSSRARLLSSGSRRLLLSVGFSAAPQGNGAGSTGAEAIAVRYRDSATPSEPGMPSIIICASILVTPSLYPDVANAPNGRSQVLHQRCESVALF